MTLDLRRGYGQVINVVSDGDRNRAGRQIERDLERAGAVAIETLHQDGRGGQSQGLRKPEFQYAQQNEKEVHRHGAGDARQAEL